MKTHLGMILTVSAIWFAFCGLANGQGFVNLNFESANVSGYPVGDMAVPISAAIPGWSASFSNSIERTIAASQIWYDGLSTGGAAISLCDSNTGAGGIPLQGRYSVILFGGEGGNSATIGQTGLVPAGTESLQFQISTLAGSLTPFVVTLGGQTINMQPLGDFSTYTEYGGDVSAFAGQVEALTITEPPPSGEPPSVLELDNIQFLASPVPEPETLVLLATGAVLFGLAQRKVSIKRIFCVKNHECHFVSIVRTATCLP